MDVKEAAIAGLKQYDVGNKFRLSALPKASVLVPLFVKNGQIYTFMTLRSKEVKKPKSRGLTCCWCPNCPELWAAEERRRWSVFPRGEARPQWRGWCAHGAARSGGGDRSPGGSGGSGVHLVPHHQQGGARFKSAPRSCISDKPLPRTHFSPCPHAERLAGDHRGGLHRRVLLPLSQPSWGQCCLLGPPGLLHQWGEPRLLQLRGRAGTDALVLFLRSWFGKPVSHLGTDCHDCNIGVCTCSQKKARIWCCIWSRWSNFILTKGST